MDMALRLSEQEASITALRLQKEEEAMMKAIQESVSTLLHTLGYIYIYMYYVLLKMTLLNVHACALKQSAYSLQKTMPFHNHLQGAHSCNQGSNNRVIE